MVGDDIVNDVGAAQKCGLKGLQVRTGKFRWEGLSVLQRTITLHLYQESISRQLRARRALMLFRDFLLKTRRELLLYKVCGNSTLLVPNVLNGTTLNSVNTLLAIGRWYTPVSSPMLVGASRLWPVPEFAHWQLQIASSHPLRNFIIGASWGSAPWYPD